MNTVKNSPLNIAFLSVLNHCEFVVTNPIVDEMTGELHASAKKMANHIGWVNMAYLCQCGYAYFNSGRRIKLKPRSAKLEKVHKAKPKGNGKEDEDVQKDDEPIEVEGKDNLQEVVESLVSSHELPPVEELAMFLKNAFTSLPSKQFNFFQSILPDFWPLQTWNRPLDYKEERSIQRIVSENIVKSKPLVDMTEATSDDDVLKLQGMKFKKISPAKRTVSDGGSKPQRNLGKPNKEPGSSIAATPKGNNVATPSSSKSYSMDGTKQRRKDKPTNPKESEGN